MTNEVPARVPALAWRMLALGVGAQTAGTVLLAAPTFLIPLLHTERGLSLAQAGLLAATPTLGAVLTLIAWGALADRVGERRVIAAGLALAALATAAAIVVDGYVALGIAFLLGGMAVASTNAASGRVVVGWFPRPRRGLAMGIRQMSQPLGTTVAALSIPSIAASAGIGAALAVPLALTAVLAVACAFGVVDPPRAAPPEGSAPVNPYRASRFLWRVHAVSVLLVVPQFTISTFGLVWLVTERAWEPLAAGVLVGVAQFVGAVGRIAIGVASDRIGSRMRPLRWVTVAVSVSMLLLALTDVAGWDAAAIVFVVATALTVAPNGLAFTAVAESAGPFWAGRALGVQNTGQFLVAAAVAPLLGALIGLAGYPVAFVVAALCPAVALPLVPRASAEDDRL